MSSKLPKWMDSTVSDLYRRYVGTPSIRMIDLEGRRDSLLKAISRTESEKSLNPALGGAESLHQAYLEMLRECTRDIADCLLQLEKGQESYRLAVESLEEMARAIGYGQEEAEA